MRATTGSALQRYLKSNDCPPHTMDQGNEELGSLFHTMDRDLEDDDKMRIGGWE